MNFELKSTYKPTGDQPDAISALVRGLQQNIPYQTLLGITGSGKTFTMANVIEKIGRPTLILSHNKTLAAQLYAEFKGFFPENAVEYFVSYYDYYQPEAYIPSSNTYIEKDLAINEEIEKLRLSATSSLLSGRNDVIVVSSVSCLYGMGNPEEFSKTIVPIHQGQQIARDVFLRQLLTAQYVRKDLEFSRGSFRVKGDTVDIYLSHSDQGLRVTFWGDEIENISLFDVETGRRTEEVTEFKIFPCNLFIASKERVNIAMAEIEIDLDKQVEFFRSIGKEHEAKRLYERVTYDLEMIREVGYCSGIENYSRYFDRRLPGSRPFCLLDFFPDDYLTIIDESHVTIPQIRAMYGGDYSRKSNLVEYGFRLPAAIDNRPLKFEEYDALTHQTIYVSATPAEYELQKSEGIVVDQLIRPTGLLDPTIVVRPSINQVDDLMEEIQLNIERNERVMVTTLTKRMAEELSSYLLRNGIKCSYIHSDIDTLERIRIIEDVRAGVYDVLIGVNLLREGLDMPEVSLVAILDADKEGFLRSHRSLTQTAGRAARNVNGRVIFYAEKITESMQKTIDETTRRREKQLLYNETHNITPTQIVKNIQSSVIERLSESEKNRPYQTRKEGDRLVAEPKATYTSKEDLKKEIEKTRKAMKKAAKELDFIEAASLRDYLIHLETMLGK